jgi:hypothetical protein
VRGDVVSAVRDDKEGLELDGASGVLKAWAAAGDLLLLSTEGGRLAGVRIDRDDAVALRDWINAALTSGAIR